MTQAPDLWANVLRLAVDELLYQNRLVDAWELLSLVCEPYGRQGEAAPAAAPQAALLASADRPGDGVVRQRRRMAGCVYFYEDLRQAATQMLGDHERFTPEQRDVAGRLLGARLHFPATTGARVWGCGPTACPTSNGSSSRRSDEQSGRRQFIYQEDEKRTEPDFWIARYPVTYAQFQTFVEADDGFRQAEWWEGLWQRAQRSIGAGRKNRHFSIGITRVSV